MRLVAERTAVLGETKVKFMLGLRVTRCKEFGQSWIFLGNRRNVVL